MVRISVLTNMISFLKRFYEALDKNLTKHDEIMAFYSDFCEAFDRVHILNCGRKWHKWESEAASSISYTIT